MTRGMIVGAAAMLLALALVLAIRRRLRSRRARRRARIAVAAETAAERLLVRHGYAILDRQVRIIWTPLLDGEPVPTELRLDLLVAKAGEVLAAEVKSGADAPRLETAATRRQLLEYRVAFAVDGVLLVEPAAGSIRRVDFPLCVRGRP
jgi:Holliday junction resolvase-like predicted endonuclease